MTNSALFLSRWMSCSLKRLAVLIWLSFKTSITDPYDTSFFRFSHYLNNLQKFVADQGGGFMMIGGDISFSQGGYDGTAIEDILL